jgi:hypothetical protein
LATATADYRILGDHGWARTASTVVPVQVKGLPLGHDTFLVGDLTVTLEHHDGDALAEALGRTPPEDKRGMRFWHFGVSVRGSESGAARKPTDEEVQRVVDDLGAAGVPGPWFEQESMMWRHVRHFFEHGLLGRS